MTRGSLRFQLFTLLLVWFALGSARAFADPVRIHLTGAVLYQQTILERGDPFSFWIFVDTDTADENAASGPYLATAPGSFELKVFDDTPFGGGEVESISADASGGQWNADLFTSGLGGGDIPITISLTGVGMTEDQILPDFSSFTSGYAIVDGTQNAFGFSVTVVVLGLNIVQVLEVPALSTGALLSLSALLLGSGLRVARIA